MLNRLTHRQLGAGAAAEIASYHDSGNIRWKRDVGGIQSTNFTYDANKPHAVATAFNYSMTYDANGNMDSRMKSGETWKFRWAPFDKPRFISKDDVGSEFRYDANRQRAVHLKFDSMTGGANSEPEHYTTKKLYFGNRMEADFVNLASGAAQDWQIKNVRVYIDGPDGRTGSFEFHPNEPPADRAKPLVYHQDHLGSIDSVTEYGVTTATFALDDDGKPSRYSYDPWGERRDPLDWDGAPGASTSPGGVTPRGFTDHEMLDELGLVHMNGRIYDGQIGRFLSADLLVQFPGSLQSFNRYSYARNRPLSRVDRSGFSDVSPPFGFDMMGNRTVPEMKPIEVTPRVAATFGLGLNGLELLGLAYAEAQTLGVASPLVFAAGVLWADDTAANINQLITGEETRTHLNRAIHDGATVAGAGPELAQEIADKGETTAQIVVGGVVTRKAMSAMGPGRTVGTQQLDDLAIDTVPATGRVNGTDMWGNPKSLNKHFRDHGADFGASSTDEYAQQAADFAQGAQKRGLPTKVEADGTTRIYDPETNTFGSYNADGTTKTFFKPAPESPSNPRGYDPEQYSSPQDYWDQQPGKLQ